MQLCQKHNFCFVLWMGDDLFECPLCAMHRKYEALEAELKEVKADLHEINLKMYPEMSEDNPREPR